MKNSDSDYKAQDQGSASETVSKRKASNKKKLFSLKLTKKEIITQAIKNFLPDGATLASEKELTEEEYNSLMCLKEAEEFSLNYRIFLGKVLHVTDGDTVKIAINLNNKMTRFTFRLSGIDTPETRKGEAREFGKFVKEVVKQMLLDKVVRVEVGQFDKYGRVLSRVYAFSEQEQFCINDFLIENDMAKSYSGKTKNEFTKRQWEEFRQKYEEKAWPVVENYPRAIKKKQNSALTQLI